MFRQCLGILAASAISACVSVPDAGSKIENLRPLAEIVQLSDVEMSLIRRLDAADYPAHRQLVKKHLPIEARVTDRPLKNGNGIQFLEDGHQTLEAIFLAIQSAQRHIDLQYYNIADIIHDGEHLGDLLIKKQLSGVHIRLIYDSYGSKGTPDAFFERLKLAGIEVVEFNPIDGDNSDTSHTVNNRDHRKFLVVDGRKVILGGVNLAPVYQSYRFRDLPADDSLPQYWIDTAALIEGPAVAEVQKIFLTGWTGEESPPRGSFSQRLSAAGNQFVRVVDSGPTDVLPRHYAALLSAIAHAEDKIWLSTGYFVPPEEQTRYLADAAKRGVDVRLVVPGESDLPIAVDAGRSRYTDLLEAGVQIYEMRNQILHSKTATVDGIWSQVGSSNLDYRSILFNREIDAIIWGEETAAQLEDIFEAHFREARKIGLSEWEKRSLGSRLREMFSLFWEKLL